MKKLIYILSLALSTTLFFTSCEDEDGPTVSLDEVGVSDCKIGIIGSDLHIQGEFVAEATSDEVSIKITPDDASFTWTFDSIYTEYSGTKNGTFHKHVDIPGDADAGNYHLYLTVTDLNGEQTSASSTLEIQEPSDSVAPVITISSAPSDGETFATGETITISGSVTDNICLAGIYIGLVRVNQELSDSEVNATNTITLLHNHDFETPTSYDFTASIEVGATYDNNITPDEITGDYAWESADYYIVVKSKDKYGTKWGFSAQYPIVININN